MESPESQSGIQSISKSSQQNFFMDWRPEAIRTVSICYIILGHMLLTTAYIKNDPRNPLVLTAGIMIGFFIFCSAYVHGLKDEFNKSGSLNISTYWKFFKTRFLRLYIGYYLALVVVLIAKLCAGYTFVFASSGLTIGGSGKVTPIIISPESMALDLTCLWPLVTGLLGGIFPEAWFIGTILILSLAYPFLRRLNSINPKYLYLIIILTTVIRIIVAIKSDPNYAFHFPFAWTAEFSFGIMIGNRICMKGGPAPPNALYQRIIINMATRVWPLYLFHMTAVVFLPVGAPVIDFVLAYIVIIILAEFFRRVLRYINGLLGVKRRDYSLKIEEKFNLPESPSLNVF